MNDVQVRLSIFGSSYDNLEETLNRNLSDLRVKTYNLSDWDTFEFKSEEDELEYNSKISKDLGILSDSDVILVYFKENLNNRFSLFILGYFRNNDNVIVFCPEEFAKKGIVRIICSQNNIPIFDSIEGTMGGIFSKVNQRIFLQRENKENN